MSCTQVAAEFSSDKFRLVHEYPPAFGSWRYTCCPNGRSFYIYRVLFAALILLLVILDFFWIIGFAGAGENDRISACLDSTQLALVLSVLVYFLLSCVAFRWSRLRFETNGDQLLSYKLVWLMYTCSINAVYTSMIIFWMSHGSTSTLEQKLKNSIPGILILADLCVNSIPLYLCHAIYVILFYFLYLSAAALGLFLTYVLGLADKQYPGPSNPTIWIGGHPLLPNGYPDFTNPHRIVTVTFGSVAMAIMVHCVLLSLVIARDFFASLFHRSTEQQSASTITSVSAGQMHTSTEPSSDTASVDQTKQ